MNKQLITSLLIASTIVLPVGANVRANSAATIDVDRLDDMASASQCTAAANDCSLRGAISYANANSGTTVRMPSGVHVLQLAGAGENDNATGDLDIKADVTIAGATSGDPTVISAGGVDRVFDLLGDSAAGKTPTIRMANLTLRDGAGDAADTATPKQTNGGGAIRAYESNLTLSTVSILSNTSRSNGGAIAFNYAIAARPTRTSLVVQDSTISANRAEHSGGGVIVGSGGLMTVTGSLITDNTARAQNSGRHGGGGLYVAQGYMPIGGAFVDTSIMLDRTSFEDNLSSNRNNAGQIDGSALGGAIFLEKASAIMTGTAFVSNFAEGREGGAIYSDGAAFVIRNGRFFGNVSLDRGGAISAANVPRGLIDGAIFESNRNSSSPNLTGGGGALYVSGSLNGGMLEIRDSNFIGNMTSGQGGAMVLGPNARLYDGLMRNNFSGSNGGAVRVSESTLDAPTIIDGAIIETNRAQVRGGGIENSGVLHLSNASIEGNETVTDSGGGISNYDAIWLVVTDTQIIGNSGVFGGGGLFNRHSFLGVRERAPRTTQLTRVEFTDNAVAKSGVDGGYGGGIANDTSLRLRDVSFRRNTAAYAGGAIFATSNYGSSGDRTAFPINLDLVNVTIGANEAETGSGVFQSAGVTHLNNVTIARNSASGTGGGVRVADGVGNATNPNAISSTNSIVALNAAGTAGPDCMGAFRSTGHMLIGNTDSCMLTGGPNDKIGTAGAPIDPLLDPLANYDNRAATFRLLAGSPAIDAGSAATCATLDARGAARNGVCDMGAYEFEGSLKQRQSIVFGALADRPLGSAPVALSATASSGLAVSFASETQAVCALTGAELRLLAVGLCRVVATQPGNSAFEPAPDARQSFTVLAGVVTPPPAGRSLRLMLPVVQR